MKGDEFVQTTDQLIAAGQTAAVNGEWSTAASAFEAAYQQIQNYDLNLQLVTVLCETQNFQQASSLALESVSYTHLTLPTKA